MVASSAPEVAPFPAGPERLRVGSALDRRPRRPDRRSIAARIVVAGESGGGNLTLATGLKLKRDGEIGLVKGLYALCPYIAGQWPAPDCPSSIENEGILLTLHNNRGAMGYGIEAFNERNPLAWPSFAERRRRHAASQPTVINVNECDPLRDEGINFYRLLLAPGVTARCRQMMGTMHGTEIFAIACPDISRDTARDIAAFARESCRTCRTSVQPRRYAPGRRATVRRHSCDVRRADRLSRSASLLLHPARCASTPVAGASAAGHGARNRRPRRPAAGEDQPRPGHRDGERGLRRHVRARLARPRYLNGTLRHKGELLQNYYAIGHVSLDNYIAQVSGQAPTEDTQADCADNGFAFANVTPGTPDADQAVNPGQVDGQGCVYPPSVQTIAAQLDAKYPPNQTTHVAAWRAYEQDMGNTPSRDGGTPDPDRWHGLRAPGHRRHRHGRGGHADRPVHDPARPLRLVPLRHRQHGRMRRQRRPPRHPRRQRDPFASGSPGPGPPQPRARRRASASSPRTCATTATTAPAPGRNSAGGQRRRPGRSGRASCGPGCRSSSSSPAYKHGDMLVVITFDEADLGGTGAAPPAATSVRAPTPMPRAMPAPRPTAPAPGAGRSVPCSSTPKYITPGSTDTKGSYNHYSALRSYEDLLGLTTGGSRRRGTPGLRRGQGLVPFGTDVFPAKLSGAATSDPGQHEAAQSIRRSDALYRLALSTYSAAEIRIMRTSERPSRDLGRHPEGQRARRDHHVVRHHRVGAHRGAPADDGVVQDDAARAGQRLVLEGAALEVGEVADDAAVADDGGEARAGVDDGAVLNGRAAPRR